MFKLMEKTEEKGSGRIMENKMEMENDSTTESSTILILILLLTHL